ncbi:hypothetical protein GYMLUDRAFT_237810 [Collybiopsis luxurians FD-317 M1]|nr:hypothetical protein GYMLUDRAFT_237810 [Collybiopsis luxurians FD-317 M1]
MSSSPEPSSPKDIHSGSESESESEQEQDTPALSHAAKRRQKKKEKLAARNGAAAPPAKKRKLDDGKAAAIVDSTKPRQNSVWVGNLSFRTTAEALRGFFDGVGEITRINMPMKAAFKPNMPPENRGFAYVDFATPDAKTVAITLSERPLLGRKLLIKDGDDYAGRPVAAANVEASSGGKTHSKTALKILKAQKQPPAPTLFLGNLPFETTEDDIRGLLNAHKEKKNKSSSSRKRKAEEEGEGEDEDVDPKVNADSEEDWIRRIRLGTFEDSGLCKGFGFVDFSSIENATSALINPKNHHLNGRNLVVEYASADAVKRGPNKPKTNANAAGGDPSTAGGDSPKKKSASGGGKFQHNDKRKLSDRRTTDHAREDSKDSRSHRSRPGDGGDGDGGEDDRSTDKKSSGRVSDRKAVSEEGALPPPRHSKGPRNRPKPGAALAQAKRQSAAIVTDLGAEKKKIVF